MISKMAFGVSHRDFLKKTGCVLTVRGYDYATESAIVPELGDIWITRKNVCEIQTAADLIGFLQLSGFETVTEWWWQIKRFCKGRMWLYRVQIIDDVDIGMIERDPHNLELFLQSEREKLLYIPYDDRPHDEQTTDQNKYSFFSGEVSHPKDEMDPQHRFCDSSFMVDLQPSKDAAKHERLQREADTAERRRERMRERAGEQQGGLRR